MMISAASRKLQRILDLDDFKRAVWLSDPAKSSLELACGHSSEMAGRCGGDERCYGEAPPHIINLEPDGGPNLFSTKVKGIAAHESMSWEQGWQRFCRLGGRRRGIQMTIRVPRPLAEMSIS
jgi:hypothetical protein